MVTVIRGGGLQDSFALRADSSALIDDFVAGGRPITWIVSDSEVRYIFSDVSAIYHLRSQYVSSSRFTSDFPCKRITRWVAFVPRNELWAARRGDPDDKQPVPFPLSYSKKESVK